MRCAVRAASVLPIAARPPCTVGGVRDPITALERAIRSLPAATRAAMLEGIREHPIVCGAYTDGRGGICPMLAAHRHGGRVTMLAFARSWDSFTRAKRVRRATARELRTLEHLLVASLGEQSELARAIAEYQATRRRSGCGGSPRRADPVDEPQQVQRRERLGEKEVRAGVLSAALHDIA